LHPHLLLALILLLALGAAGAFARSEFEISGVRTELAGGEYLLDADIDYVLSDDAREALNNGVPITFQVDVVVVEQRPWLWDRNLRTVSLRFALQHHALAQVYQVIDLTAGKLKNYPALSAALEALGKIRRLPIVSREKMGDGGEALVRIKAWLDIDSLPLPLRLLAYMSAGWRLESNWYTWLLVSRSS
jgi:hypothetical protein